VPDAPFWNRHPLRLPLSLDEAECDHCEAKGLCVIFDLLAFGIIQLCEACLRRALTFLEKQR
jgi:hypothetical protein